MKNETECNESIATTCLFTVQCAQFRYIYSIREHCVLNLTEMSFLVARMGTWHAQGCRSKIHLHKKSIEIFENRNNNKCRIKDNEKYRSIFVLWMEMRYWLAGWLLPNDDVNLLQRRWDESGGCLWIWWCITTIWNLKHFHRFFFIQFFSSFKLNFEWEENGEWEKKIQYIIKFTIRFVRANACTWHSIGNTDKRRSFYSSYETENGKRCEFVDCHTAVQCFISVHWMHCRRLFVVNVAWILCECVSVCGCMRIFNVCVITTHHRKLCARCSDTNNG